jgi:hypothetical protein
MYTGVKSRSYLKNILLWVLLSCLSAALWGQSLPIEREQVTPMPQLSQSLKAQALSSVQLRSFEQRALQKARDLPGYLRMSSDSSVDVRLRQRADRLAARQFVQPEDWSRFREQWLQRLQQAPFDEAFSLQNLHLSQALQGNASQLAPAYVGQLEGSMLGEKLQLNIVVRKVGKSFGDRQEEVWKVFFSHPQP